jgi:general secretion pathway protein E
MPGNMPKTKKQLKEVVPPAFARSLRLVPLTETEDSLEVGIHGEGGREELDLLSLRLQKRVVYREMTESEILEKLQEVYGDTEGDAEEIIQDLSAEVDDASLARDLEKMEDLLDSDNEAPIIRLLNRILARAVQLNASDVHLEPFREYMRVRYRIDGVLYERLKIPARHQALVVSRVKVLSKLDIAEKRLPQDGRIRLKVGVRDVDIRVSTLPTAFGERVVLRLLDQTTLFLGLEDIGMAPDTFAQMERLLQKTQGMILVTGPTGSGKTTTLYAALDRINAPGMNIITIEDPIEYQITGISQIPVNPKTGLSFATGLRSIVRQDPDVILVGEIRDLETAEIATHAALTGHLVFSTLHTIDAASAVTRLIDMGIEPFLVTSSVDAIVAQRLIRTVCPHCREPYQPSSALLEELGIKPAEFPRGTFYRGKGCDACMGTGYLGRTGIYEMLACDERLEKIIAETSDAGAIRKAAIASGMRRLSEDGVLKVLAGETTPEEVLRVVQE